MNKKMNEIHDISINNQLWTLAFSRDITVKSLTQVMLIKPEMNTVVVLESGRIKELVQTVMWAAQIVNTKLT